MLSHFSFVFAVWACKDTIWDLLKLFMWNNVLELSARYEQFKPFTQIQIYIEKLRRNSAGKCRKHLM